MLATIDDITAAKVDRDRKVHGAGYLRVLADGRVEHVPRGAVAPDLLGAQIDKIAGPWMPIGEASVPPADQAPMRFAPVAVPAEVQARYDALSEVEKARLRAEVDEMVDGLYAKCGVTRQK